MIRITSNSIDELNYIYKKLKKDFRALDKIKLNEDTEYEMRLQRHEIDAALKSILDKVIDADELLDEPSVFDDFSFQKLKAQMEGNLAFISLKPLKNIWNELTTGKQQAAYHYLCKEKEIEDKEEIDVIVPEKEK